MPQGYDGLPNFYVQSSNPITGNLGLSLKGCDPIVAENFYLIDTAFGSGGTSVEVNGSVVNNPKFNGTTPAAPPGNTNVIWQVSGSSVSAYVPTGVASVAWSALTGTLSNGQVIPYADAGISRLGPASLAVGNGTNGSITGALSLQNLNVLYTFNETNVSQFPVAIFTTEVIDNTGSSAGVLQGGYAKDLTMLGTGTGSGQFFEITAFVCNTLMRGSATAQQVYGYRGAMDNQGSGTVNLAAGLAASCASTGTGFINNAYGLFISTNSGNKVHNYANIFMQDHVAFGADTSTYGIYITGGLNAIHVGSSGPNGGPNINSGISSPEGNVFGAVGSIFMRTDGGASSSFYVKESGGAGSTGWVAAVTTPAINTWAGLTGTLTNGQVIPYADAGISRLGAASLAIGNGTANDFTGQLSCGKMGVGTTSPNVLNGNTFASVVFQAVGGASGFGVITAAGPSGVILNDTSQAADSRLWAFANSATVFSISTYLDVGTPTVRLGLSRTGNLTLTGNIISAGIIGVTTGGVDDTSFYSGGQRFFNNAVLNWSSTSVSVGATDVGISRLGAASLAIGNGTAASYAGALKLTTLNNQGGAIVNRAAKSGGYTTTAADYILTFTATATLVLDSGAAVSGTTYRVKLGTASALGSILTLSPNNGKTIEGAATLVITTLGNSVDVVYDGASNWEVF